MGRCESIYEEIRFDLRDEELTQAYVLVRAVGDCPIGVQGWHHKTFPASLSTLGILQRIATGEEESWVMWPLKAPGQ